MELVHKPLPRFRYEYFRACRKKYQQLGQKVCWEDWGALRKHASSLKNKSAHLVGHIAPETAKKWLDWDLGELFVVACDGDLVFCSEGGLIVSV